MSNQAKDWQEGVYTIRVKNNFVSANTIKQVRENGPYGDYLRIKEFTAVAKCDPEDEFSLSMGVVLAMDRLSKKLNEGIKVGDKVKIVDNGLSYITYVEWIAKNVDDVKLAACFDYKAVPVKGDTEYIVKAIAPWMDDDNNMLAYIQRYETFSNGGVSTNQPCYLIRVDGLEKV